MNLVPREQFIIAAGGALTVVFLFYLIIWSPFTTSVQTLKAEVNQQKILLSWMEKNAVELKRLRQAQPKQYNTTKTSLITLVERSLKSGNIATFKPELNQMSAKQVSIKFNKVSFNELINWLNKVRTRYAIQANKINIQATETLGVVTAQIVI